MPKKKESEIKVNAANLAKSESSSRDAIGDSKLLKQQKKQARKLKKQTAHEKTGFSIKRLFLVLFLVLVTFSFLVTYGVINLHAIFPENVANDIHRIVTENVTQFFDIVNFITQADNISKILATVSSFVITTISILVINGIIDLILRFGKRARTISALVHSLVKFVLIAIFLVGLLNIWAPGSTVALAAVLGGAGIAIGFAAQDVVKDMLSGLFNITEDSYSVGDVVEVDGFKGFLTHVGLRSIRIQDWMGDVKIFRNSCFDTIVNHSKILSTAICDAAIAYEEDIPNAEKVIDKLLPTLQSKYTYFQSMPAYLGVQTLGDSHVGLRVIVRVDEPKKFDAERALNREIKLELDKNNISIPFPQVMIHEAPKSKKK